MGDTDEDEEYKLQVAQLRQSIPFAVCGANAMVEVAGKKVRGRQYPWGVVEVENPEHCDFVKLRSMLITHMQELPERSSCSWRIRVLDKLSSEQSGSDWQTWRSEGQDAGGEGRRVEEDARNVGKDAGTDQATEQHKSFRLQLKKYK